MLFLLCWLSPKANSQYEYNLKHYGGSWDKINVGDSMQYRISTINSTAGSINSSIRLKNNTIYNYSLTLGLIYTEKVIGKYINLNGEENVYSEIVVRIPNQTEFISSSQLIADGLFGFNEIIGTSWNLIPLFRGTGIFLLPSLENTSSIKNFIPYYPICNFEDCPIYNTYFNISNDHYYVNFQSDYYLIGSLFGNYSVDWKTGWLD